ncbi:hypothetical protein [Actinacidiphila bryophytorum]|uniref:hypothetical protein n=1 Tax=Actinacidiphila bryophytorum TaxID=1436133 RepID=UPI002176C47E|nr:hypothetical protein [Actinacidiphila bryophytorum]UWE10204.1 hypothetical protein NYE86_16785 [Actinacidiphila bryophytorum]
MALWEQVTEAGTIDELVEDSVRAGQPKTARTIHDWVARGLLDRPQRRTRHRGSDKALHSVRQRQLFLVLLDKSAATPKLNTLAQIPLATWLYWGDDWVPTRQAARAMRTWLGDATRNLEVAEQGARGLLAQLDHPQATDSARAKLVRLGTALGSRPRFTPADKAELAAAAREVFQPAHTFAPSGLTRAIGHPEAPVTVESFIGITEAIKAGISHITGARQGKARDLRPSDAQMERVRRVHRRHMPEYLNRRPIWAAAAPPALQGMFTEPTMQERFNSVGRDFLIGIGFDVLHGGRLP